jgi:TonB family protein
MSHSTDIADYRDFDQPQPLKGSLTAAIALHVTVIAGFGIYGWVNSHRDTFGAKDAGGGAIGIQAVKAIPIPHSGPQNPLANESQSQVPQEPVKPAEKVEKEIESPDAVALLKKRDKRQADVASEKQKFRPFKELEANQVFSKQAPQVSSPLYSAMAGSGRIGTGSNTTLGTRFGGYAQQVQQLVAQKWRTGDVDAHIQTAPTVVATFDLMRDGTARNIQILQTSGISPLDNSVRRAILDASPFPPIPNGFDRDSAKVEFWFELKR